MAARLPARATSNNVLALRLLKLKIKNINDFWALTRSTYYQFVFYLTNSSSNNILYSIKFTVVFQMEIYYRGGSLVVTGKTLECRASGCEFESNQWQKQACVMRSLYRFTQSIR